MKEEEQKRQSRLTDARLRTAGPLRDTVLQLLSLLSSTIQSPAEWRQRCLDKEEVGLAGYSNRRSMSYSRVKYSRYCSTRQSGQAVSSASGHRHSFIGGYPLAGECETSF